MDRLQAVGGPGDDVAGGGRFTHGQAPVCQGDMPISVPNSCPEVKLKIVNFNYLLSVLI
jgi:hypothetical protein